MSWYVPQSKPTIYAGAIVSLFKIGKKFHQTTCSKLATPDQYFWCHFRFHSLLAAKITSGQIWEEWKSIIIRGRWEVDDDYPQNTNLVFTRSSGPSAGQSDGSLLICPLSVVEFLVVSVVVSVGQCLGCYGVFMRSRDADVSWRQWTNWWLKTQRCFLPLKLL